MRFLCLSIPPPVSDLKPGQYVDCLLEDVKSEGRLVRLSVDPSAISEAVADTEHGWTLSNLCPGLLVNATVKTVSHTAASADSCVEMTRTHTVTDFFFSFCIVL